jgi:hypothetical protein
VPPPHAVSADQDPGGGEQHGQECDGCQGRGRWTGGHELFVIWVGLARGSSFNRLYEAAGCGGQRAENIRALLKMQTGN